MTAIPSTITKKTVKRNTYSINEGKIEFGTFILHSSYTRIKRRSLIDDPFHVAFFFAIERNPSSKRRLTVLVLEQALQLALEEVVVAVDDLVEARDGAQTLAEAAELAEDRVLAARQRLLLAAAAAAAAAVAVARRRRVLSVLVQVAPHRCVRRPFHKKPKKKTTHRKSG